MTVKQFFTRNYILILPVLKGDLKSILKTWSDGRTYYNKELSYGKLGSQSIYLVENTVCITSSGTRILFITLIIGA